MIFVPKMPASIINITTNSSSEIFVIGRHKTPELVDQIIDAGGWRWWFGDRKQIKDLAEAREFLKGYGHVASALFDFHGWPSGYEYQEAVYPIQRELEKALEPIKEKQKQLRKQTNKAWTEEEKEENYWKPMRDFQAQEMELIEKYQNKWIDEQKSESLIGMYYYECEEDNQLHDWDTVHMSVPGNYARLS
jgi:hypothetical protein